MNTGGQELKEIINEEIRNLLGFIRHEVVDDVTCLDLRGVSDISDYFFIITVGSFGQMRGVLRLLHEYFFSHQIDCRGGKHLPSDEIWLVLDCEYFMIHLMTEDSRDFYALDELWLKAGGLLLTN